MSKLTVINSGIATELKQIKSNTMMEHGGHVFAGNLYESADHTIQVIEEIKPIEIYHLNYITIPEKKE